MNISNRTKTISLVLICVIILTILLSIAINLISKSEEQEQTILSDNLVVKIIDGDTFQIASGETIRLICVDTPETGTEGADDAANFLFSLIYNQEVRLESDIDDKDAYGRLLRYVYVRNTVSDHPKNSTNNQESFFDVSFNGEEIFVNKEIVQQGYGTLFPYGNSAAKCDEIGN